jgi:sugar phosphate isomerase/epimerase
MDRRVFLRVTAGSAAGAACLGPFGLSGCEPAAHSGQRSTPQTGQPLSATPPLLTRVGLQLYTVRDLMADDVARTLDLVAETGYREVEFAGYFGRSPAAIGRLVEATGLSAPSAHVSLPQLRNELDIVLEASSTVGHRSIVLPSLPDEYHESLDRFRRLCGELNEIGEACRAAGVRFAYHNHVVEFEPVDGGVPYDVMLEECDPELVAMQVDFYWMLTGGRDPLEYFNRHPGRFVSCHLKDMDASGSMVDVGHGVTDWAALFAEAEQAGLQHYFVEHDRPRNPERSIRRSLEYLTGVAE